MQILFRLLQEAGCASKTRQIYHSHSRSIASDLITDATEFHEEYDNYQFPDNIRVVQVAGWGDQL